MSVFISGKDKAKLSVQFFTPKQPKVLILTCKNKLIYIRDLEAVKKTCSRALSDLKTQAENIFLLIF